MPHGAYVNIWTRDFSEGLMLDRFERLLETVPLAAEKPGLIGLTVRAVNPSETPLAEIDLRGALSGPADVIALARERRNADTEFEVSTYWDLWRWDFETGLWQRGPERLLLFCRGEACDDGIAAQTGNFAADLGFEHLFTGPAGWPEFGGARNTPANSVETELLPPMSIEQLHEYYEKTRQNIQQLFQWLRAVEQALPIERYQLWSEGEENLEARLDEILAVH